MSIIDRRNNVLRGDYLTTVQVGLVIALLVLILPLRLKYTSVDEVEYNLQEQEVVQMEEIQQTQQIEKPPPPPRPPIPVEVPNDEIFEDVSLDLDVSLDMDEVMDLPPPPPPVEVEEEPEPEIFIVVEKMPELIGGTDELYKNVKYPEIARQAGLEGLVVLQTIINEDGVPTDIIVIRTAGSLLDKEAIKGLSLVRFVPGRQRGKNVKVRMSIPIRFRLRD